MLSLAADLQRNEGLGRLTLVAPVITPATAEGEWRRLLPALDVSVRSRMTLEIVDDPPERAGPGRRLGTVPEATPLERPNYRYEVLRLLVNARLRDEAPPTILELMSLIGASQTPIRQALTTLKDTGLVHAARWGLQVDVESLSQETLAKVHALPQTLRFRFERGAGIKSPATLLDRALPLLQPTAPAPWKPMALSGVAVAQREVPHVDIAGLPRLDLVAHIGRTARTFDTGVLRMLDDGLELEPNVLAPAPVVITLTRSAINIGRQVGPESLRWAAGTDIFLSLLDLGLRHQAIQYVTAADR